jgi:O-antigen ligase
VSSDTVVEANATPARALVGLGALFLAAHFFSFAAVNVALVAGMLVALGSGPGRGGLSGPWPGRVRGALGLFAAWVVLSMLGSPETWADGSVRTFHGIFKPVLAMLLGYAGARVTPGLAAWMLPRISWLAVAFLVPALPSMHDYRIALERSIYGKAILGPNVLGGFFGCLLLLHLWHAWGKGRDRSLADHLLAAGLLLGVIVSGSRSAMILVVAGALATVVWRLSLRTLLQGAGLAVGALAILLLANPRFVPGRFTSPSWELNIRFSIWRQALTVIQRRPVLGCGARRYDDMLRAIYPDYLGVNPDGTFYYTDSDENLIGKGPSADAVTYHPHDAHNDYLTMAARHGLPGLAFYLLFLGSVLRAAHRVGLGAQDETSGLARGVFAMLVGVLGYTVFNACWFNKEWGPFTFWWVGAILAAVASREAEVAGLEGDAP